MRKFILLTLLFASVCALAGEDNDIGLTAHNISDTRVSLGLSTRVKHRQLVNMRTQLQATQMIIGLLADGKFDKASGVSRSGFGLTDEMKQIYKLSANEDFKKLGLAFHDSATELETALQTQDMKKSLQALHNTLGYCVQCHRKFRQ